MDRGGWFGAGLRQELSLTPIVSKPTRPWWRLLLATTAALNRGTSLGFLRYKQNAKRGGDHPGFPYKGCSDFSLNPYRAFQSLPLPRRAAEQPAAAMALGKNAGLRRAPLRSTPVATFHLPQRRLLLPAATLSPPATTAVEAAAFEPKWRQR